MNNTPVSIMGCGWLGLPLAKRLLQLGYVVKGSTTALDKILQLQELKISPFLITASPQLSGEDIPAFFQSKILILNIPFKRSFRDPYYYKQQIESVIAHIELSQVEFVIFTSSTSIYPGSVKNALEDEPIAPDNPRSRVLQDIEQALLSNQNFQATVIRYSGMYGGNRKIGKLLAGRSGLADGNAPVNLIHLDDCIEIIVRVIQKNIRDEIFNACSDGHPTREEIYTKSAAHYAFQAPQFNDEQTKFKIVSNVKLKEKLGYVFRHPDPMIFN